MWCRVDVFPAVSHPDAIDRVFIFFFYVLVFLKGQCLPKPLRYIKARENHGSTSDREGSTL